MNGPLRKALESTITAAPVLKDRRHAALVALCRMLADQCDAAGPNASTRLTAAYLSALKDLGRAQTPVSSKLQRRGGAGVGSLATSEIPRPEGSTTKAAQP